MSAALAACQDQAPNEPHETGSSALGSVALSLSVSGHRIDRVQLTVASETLDPPLDRSRVLIVSDPNATVSATEYGLPAGSYGVELAASLVDDPETAADESAIACAGAVAGVQVTAGALTVVDGLVLHCGEGGGSLQTAGGLVIDAEVQVDLTPACGDLVRELYVAPLQTSVGGEIALTTVAEEGVQVAWSARAGTFSEDGRVYTCPAIAGRYALTAKFSRDEGCERTVTREVECRSAYQGSCETLPPSFALEGSCELPSPCHVTQNGCAWEASCRGTVLSGEGEGASFPFIDASGRTCSGTLEAGGFVGSCGEGETACSFAANEQPALLPFCERLPATLTQVTTCGKTYASCDVIQEGCTYQASCDQGAEVFVGSLRDHTLTWDTRVDDKSVRCTGPLVAGAVAGTCTERGRNLQNPLTCDDFALQAPPDGAGGSCDETLPEDGFVLAGCGLDSICFATQRNCVWQVSCGAETYRGTATEGNRFDFEAADGRACSASVVDGRFIGRCEGSGESCEFAPIEATQDDSCFQIPARVSTGGCGAFWDCDVLQSGCDFQARCQGGEFAISGNLSPTGIGFPGLNGYTCSADLSPDGSRLLGECTLENADGSISQCRDLTEQQGARLIIDWD